MSEPVMKNKRTRVLLGRSDDCSRTPPRSVRDCAARGLDRRIGSGLFRGFASVGLLLFVAVFPALAADTEQIPSGVDSERSLPGQGEAPDLAPEAGEEDAEATDLDVGDAEEVNPFAEIETIEITGKAGQSLAVDTAESVTVFDSEDLAALGVSDIADISQVTPNLEIRVSGATSANFFIRGVGLADFSANAASAVAIYQDGVAMNSPAIQLGQIFDVENIEVLRGPQGAGSGRNASAGAIKIYSRKPSGNFSADLRTTTGRYQSDVARKVLMQSYEGAIEMPLVEDVLSTRLAFRIEANDPYMYNGCGGLPPVVVPPVAPGFISQGVFSPGDNPARPYWRGGYAPKLRRTGLSLCGRQRLDMTKPTWEYDDATGQVTPNRNFLYDETPGNLPSAVGDKGNWGLRGQLRYQPLDAAVDMDWILNIHGGRLDQFSTLGQAIGTNVSVVGAPNAVTSDEPDVIDYEKIAETGYGGAVGVGRYQEPDTEEELVALYEKFKAQKIAEGVPSTDVKNEAAKEAFAALQANLARNRPLDIRPYRGDYNRVGKTKLDTWGASLNGTLYLDTMEVQSITGYEGYDRYRETDQDFTPIPLFEAIMEDRAWQFSQEVQAGGENESGVFSWTLGGYFLTEDLTFSNRQFIVNEILSGNTPGGVEWLRAFEQTTYAFAANAGFKWEFLEGFTLDVGIRYNWERKDFSFGIRRPNFAPAPRDQSRSWAAPTGNVILTYLLDDTRAIYWKYGHGFKAGHYNSIDRGDAPAKPESIDAVEAGFRGIFLDGRLSMDGAIFYYQYQDYQVFLFDDQANRPPSLGIKNAAETEQYGAEFNLAASPLLDLVDERWSGLNIVGRFSWLRSRFLDFTNTRTGNFQGQLYSEVVDYTGNSLPNSPNFKLSATVEWAFELDGLGTLTPRYDLAWTDDLFFDPSNGVGVNRTGPLPELALGQSSYLLHNLRLSYRNLEGTAEVALWARNLTDVRYRDYAFDATAFSSLILNFVGEPRSMGIDFTLHF